MRISEAIHIINREELPSDRDFPFIYTHINKADAKELRRLDRKHKRDIKKVKKG